MLTRSDGDRRTGPTARRTVVVIGAGIGGLTAALLLSHAGHDVTVLERASAPGGKLREVEAGGLRIDSGPTVLTMRPVFEAIFALAGESFGDQVALERADILARHHWEDGTVFDLHADPDETENAIGSIFGTGEARGYRAFNAHAAEVFRTLETPFLEAAEPGIAGLVRASGPAGLPALGRIGAFSTLWKVVSRHFRDERLRQLFGRYATYCGSSPFEAPGPLALIAHVEQSGVWLPRDGMHALAATLVRLAEARGARFRFGREVQEIVARQGRASGVRLADGETVPAEAVLMNGDPGALAGGMLGEAARGAVGPWRASQRSLSALTFSIAARAEGFPLERHNVFFSNAYRAEFDDIFGHGRLPAEPTVYLCAEDRGLAPARPSGSLERMFLIVNAPATGDTRPASQGEIDRCTERTISRLSRAGLTIADGFMETTTPADFERLFPGTGGALYGRACHGWMASFQRPTARSRLPGLYLAGGAAHPGPGLPMAALSGRHAATAMIRDFASTVTFHRGATPGGMSTRSATTASTP